VKAELATWQELCASMDMQVKKIFV